MDNWLKDRIMLGYEVQWLNTGTLLQKTVDLFLIWTYFANLGYEKLNFQKGTPAR